MFGYTVIKKDSLNYLKETIKELGLSIDSKNSEILDLTSEKEIYIKKNEELEFIVNELNTKIETLEKKVKADAPKTRRRRVSKKTDNE